MTLNCCFVSALVGVVFQQRQSGAFAVYRMWQSLGLAVCFALSSTVHCTGVKTVVSVACCLIQGLLYVVAEFRMLTPGDSLKT